MFHLHLLLVHYFYYEELGCLDFISLFLFFYFFYLYTKLNIENKRQVFSRWPITFVDDDLT